MLRVATYKFLLHANKPLATDTLLSVTRGSVYPAADSAGHQHGWKHTHAQALATSTTTRLNLSPNTDTGAEDQQKTYTYRYTAEPAGK